MSSLPFENIKRKLLVKKESSPSKDIGYSPDKRSTEELLKYGIVNIDKPRGPSSHQVSDYVKRILNLSKAGHSGTLDPNVTGCLPVALAEGTKALTGLLTAGKEYICSMHLHKEVDKKKIIAAFKKFTGIIKQLPPIKSAVKRQLREREIYYLEIIEIEGAEVFFKVGCQAGTYIRKLCHDIGKELGVGAHMAELRRTKAGPFNDQKICTLQDLADAYHYYKEKKDDKLLKKYIVPIEDAVSHLAKIVISDDVIFNITHGATLHVPGVAKIESHIKKKDLIAVMSLKGELVALVEAEMTSEEIMKVEKGIVAKTIRVIMSEKLYPKISKDD